MGLCYFIIIAKLCEACGIYFFDQGSNPLPPHHLPFAKVEVHIPNHQSSRETLGFSFLLLQRPILSS